MRYNIYLILIITLILSVNSAYGQDTRYRVELLVLTHLDHQSDPREMMKLEDYSDSLDFLTPPPEKDAEVETETGAIPEPGLALAEETLTSEDSEATKEEEPPAVIHIEEMSSTMQEAWRRLRLSAPFRPQQYLSWEQGDEEPFPTLRIHDLEVVMVEDPFAGLRAGLLEEEGTVVMDEPIDPLAEPEEPAIPEPKIYYRLDGVATLKRTRFLHLDLDLQLREAIWNQDPVTENTVPGLVPSLTPPVSQADESTEYVPPPPSAFLIHELKQTRQVKTQRMEYFDGPVLGVLAYITSIKVENPEAP